MRKRKKTKSQNQVSRVRRKLALGTRKRIENESPRPSEEGAVSPVHEKIKKRSVFKRLFSICAAVLLLGLTFITVTTSILSVYLDDSRVRSILSELIDTQTNGRFEIESLEFDVWSGLRAEGIKIYPTRDEKSNVTPMVEIEKIEVFYSLWRLFFLNLKVDRAKIFGPSIKIYQVDGRSNAEFFLDKAVLQKRLARENRKPEDLPIFLRLAKFYIPLSGDISEVGFSKLDVEFSKLNEKDMKNSFSRILNLSFDVDLNWLLIDIEGGIRVHSPKGERSYIGHKVPGQDIYGEVTLDNAFIIKALNQFEIDLDNKVEKVRAAEKTFTDIPLVMKSKIDVGLDLQSVTIQDFVIKAAHALTFQSKGKISVVDRKEQKFFVDTESQLELRLNRLEKFVKTFLPDALLQGRIDLSDVVVAGELATKDKKQSIPSTAALLRLENVSFRSKAIGVEINALQSSTELNLSPSLISSGMTANITNETRLGQLTASTKSDKNQMSTNIQDFKLSLATRATYPEISLPNLKLYIESGKILAKNPRIGTVETKLMLDTNASVAKNFSNVSSSGHFDVGTLAEANWLVSCLNDCTQLRANSQVSLLSLEKLYALIKPIAMKMTSAAKLPDNVSGDIKIRLTSKGKIPKLDNLNNKTLIESSDLNVSFSTALHDFGLQAKSLMGVNVKDLDFEFQLDGDALNQKSVVKISLPSMQAKPSGFKKTLGIHGLGLQMEILNAFSERFKPGEPLKNVRTNLDLNVNIIKSDIPDFFPVSLENISLDFDVVQSDLEKLNINSLAINVPTLGIESNNKTALEISEDMKPKNIETSGYVLSEKDISEAKVAKVQTKGRARFDYDVKTPNLDLFKIEAGLFFDNFSVVVPNDKAGEKPVFLVENVDGKIPVVQTVSISDAKGRIAKASSAASTSVSSTSKEKKQETKVSDQEVIDVFYNEQESLRKRSRNLMEKVDFANIKHFYRDQRTLTIKTLGVKGINATNIVTDFEINDANINVKNFSFNILGGNVQGQLNLAHSILPIDLSMGMHFTGINTRILLNDFPEVRKKLDDGFTFDKTTIGGIFNLDYDFGSQQINGGLEVTQIGKEQLKAILYFIDPKESDPTLSIIRNALFVGDLEVVKVPINDGNVGLEFDLTLLGAPLPTPKLTKFPVSQMIKNFQTSVAKNSTSGDQK